MTKKNIILITLTLAVITVLAFIFSQQMKPKQTLPYYTFDADSNKLRQSSLPDLKISSFKFKDQRSDVVTEKQLEGKVFIADYFFVTCPGICKEMGSQMQRIYRTFENNSEVILLSHTSKPEEDTPDILMAYAKKLKVTDHNKWLFLTGNKKDLYNVARNQYHIVDDTGDGGEDDFIHTERFVLVDQQGFIRGYYDGTSEKEVDSLIKDIEKLLQN